MPNTYHQLRYHIVFGTKLRSRWIDEDLQDPLYRFIRGIIESEGGHMIAINGMPDHIHILSGLKPTVAVSRFLKQIKGSSSHWVNQEFDRDETFGWQEGYAAFSVSPSRVGAVRQYIRNQEEHHRKRSFGQELRWLIESHGLDSHA